MKKKFLIGLVIAVFASLSIVAPVAADDPTNVTVDWNGNGSVTGTVNTGDAQAQFSALGNQVGQFTAVDQNNNPYGYGVDSAIFTMDTNISGGGLAEMRIDRLTSQGMYGLAGQSSYIGVSTVDGTASLQNRSTTNYAAMIDGNYGWNANNHITVADSSFYTLSRWINSGIGNSATISAIGDGSANLNCMFSEARGLGTSKLGAGAGCYTNASFTATGNGTVTLAGVGNTSATTAMAPGMLGATSFNFIANWLNTTLTIPDYSTVVQ